MIGIHFIIVITDLAHSLFGSKTPPYDPYNDDEWDTWTTYTESSDDSFSTCLDGPIDNDIIDSDA